MMIESFGIFVKVFEALAFCYRLFSVLLYLSRVRLPSSLKRGMTIPATDRLKVFNNTRFTFSVIYTNLSFCI